MGFVRIVLAIIYVLIHENGMSCNSHVCEDRNSYNHV